VDVRGTGGNIEILGLDGKYTMCLIDGVDNNSFAGAMSRSTNFAEMPTGMIERIEVVRGPASSLYGSEAVAGIVNVITRTAPRQPAYSVTSSFDSATSKVLKFSGEEQQRTLGFSGGQQIGNLGFFIGYNKRDAEARGVETDNYRANLQYEFSPAYKLTLKSAYYDEVLTKIRGGKAIETGYRKPSIALLWEMKPDEVSSLKLKGAYSYFTKESLTEFTDTEYEQDAQKREGEILYTRPFGDSNLVTLGYNYKRELVNRPNYNVVGDQADHGLLIQDEIDFEPFFAPLTVVLGSRIDSYDSWGTHFIPSAAAIYKVSVPDLRFRASAGKAFKSPTVSQLYRDMWDHGGFLAVDGNPDLEPENSFGYQLGAEYRNRYLMTKVTFYDNDVTNKIDGYMTDEMHPLNPEKEVPIYSYRNVPEDHTRNITVDAFSRLRSYLTARLGYTCIIEADASEEGDDFLRVLDRPKHKMTFEPDLKVGALGINLRGEYIGKRWISGGRDEPDKKADGYSLAHAKFTLDVGKAIRHFYSGIPKTVTTRLSFAVNNIFDKKIEESGSGMMSGGGDTEGVGRSARLGISIGMLMD
jgi:outer membrane receptor for ferrienterochelin and colicins